MEFSPRVEERLALALRSLSADQPIAETWRELGEIADRLGVPRPGYTTARRLVRHERKRRADVTARLEGAIDLYTTHSAAVATGGLAVAVDHARRAREARPRR
jgi:hypothetical protein